MKLTDYAARLTHSHGDERTTHLRFRCPCRPDCTVEIIVAFTPALDGSETPAAWKPWKRESGSTLEDLTLSPSIHLHPSPHEKCAGWHGFLQNGELKTC